MFFNFGDSQDYIIEIYEGNMLINRQKLSVPSFIAQQQFTQLCLQCKQSGRPMKCKIIKYEWVEKRPTPLELSIEMQTWKWEE